MSSKKTMLHSPLPDPKVGDRVRALGEDCWEDSAGEMLEDGTEGIITRVEFAQHMWTGARMCYFDWVTDDGRPVVDCDWDPAFIELVPLAERPLVEQLLAAYA